MLYDTVKPLEFTVVSEDLGRALKAYVLLDFKGLNSKETLVPICGFNIPAGSLDTVPPRRRECPLELSPLLVSAGCHSISAVVSHDFQLLTGAPVEQGDVDIATWVWYVGVQPPDPAFKPCDVGPIPPDAGSDASDGGGL